MSEPRPFNPLDRLELGKSVERALLAKPLSPLPPQSRFPGAGLYAIYYSGSLPLYESIVPPRVDEGSVPIYVGRARPPGARHGVGLEATTTEPKLYERLREHKNSIRQVTDFAIRSGTQNLDLADFTCRYLVAEDIWVPLGEMLLIGHYRPVWNVLLDGFGNHPPGSGRRDQARSYWDELHPGRPWAARLAPPDKSAEELAALVHDHLSGLTLPNLDAVPPMDVEVEQAMITEELEELSDSDLAPESES
ncbi:Eco29kI family restriction endonuclease [Mycobacterium sp. 1245805.9]|uniref:Eco29kI family restriction endonuclease n=1 Tax=Mycobacterium sp. 1245805.9 TaxID=1856862 RepID=UPI0009EF05DA|nr:Eco29kI family restriction endonuclease [Mycobacterium sp. 1245805.9]